MGYAAGFHWKFFCKAGRLEQRSLFVTDSCAKDCESKPKCTLFRDGKNTHDHAIFFQTALEYTRRFDGLTDFTRP